MPIKTLPLEMQPREKATINGINTLSDAELIALFLRTGHKNLSVVGLANLLLVKFQDLNQLSKATFNEIKMMKGIGRAKAIEIIALFEIARRINNQSIQFINQPLEAINVARQLLPNYYQEHFIIIVLANNKKLIYRNKIASGKEDSLNLSPKIVLAEILKRDGFGFYCFHNHPSGKQNPSSADVMMTESLAYYCDLFGIKFLGHYVLTEKGHKQVEISDKM